MRCAIFWASAAALALAGCGGPEDENAATASGSAVQNGAPPGASPAPANPMATNAQQYVALASGGDMFEIQSARIALQKAESAEVRGLAQMVLSDHQRSSAQLAAAGAQAQPPLAPAPVLSPSQQTSIEALQRAQDTAFDRLWLHQQVVAHQQALDVAAAYARDGDSAPLRGQAAATIAAIQTHLTLARRLEAEALAQPKQVERPIR
jgi:putative membrane protein